MQIYVAITLSVLILFTAIAAAMLGAAMAVRMKPELDGAPPRLGHMTDGARRGAAGPSPWSIRLCDVARRDEKWGMLRPYAIWPPPHMP